MGARLNLGPADVPGDRVLELSKHLEAAQAANRDLLARIREMEAQGLGREQALGEAFREAEAATAEVVKARVRLQDMSAEIVDLRATIQRMEREDIEMLRAVIAALDRLLPPSRREP